MTANEPTGIYITPEQYAIALKNGINERNLYQRLYKYGWTIENAMTKPLKYATQANEDWKKWQKTSLAHGISASTFRKRIYRGMGAEEAATRPLICKGRNRKNETISTMVEV